MNKAIIIGRLTDDPSLETTTSGVSVCKFSLAVNRPYKNPDGETPADFLNIVVWREAAQNCAKYLSKGRQAAVIGSIQTRKYEGKDGVTRYITEIIAESVEFIGSKGNSAEKSNDGSKAGNLKPIEDDDLPF